MKKKTVVIHSGGMDSSICLRLAMEEFKPHEVLSLSFSYNQRHEPELKQAEKICRDWGIDHVTLSIPFLKDITDNALINSDQKIQHIEGQAPNTLVVGRNGLMAQIGSIHAQHLGASSIYMGVIEVEAANSGYRDCSRAYMDLKEKALRLDLDSSTFAIRTPLIYMTKKETLEVAHSLGVLDYLLENTITCYEGIPHRGCQQCPACKLRNEGIEQFFAEMAKGE